VSAEVDKLVTNCWR